MNLCLSRDEIHELTRSRTRAGQRAFLVQNGIRHYLDAHGWPVVTRAAVVEPSGAPGQDKAAWVPAKALSLRKAS
jgi:hypothetical protein